MFLFRGFELFRTVLSVKRLWCHVKGFPPSPSTEDGCKKSRLTAERKRHWWSQIFICEPSTAGLISQKEVSVNHLKHKKKLVENADHVVYACLCWIFFVRCLSLHFYSSVLFDEEMNDPNCQQNVTCIHLHIQRKKHVLYTDSAWRNTCKVRKAILQLSKSKYVDINICTYMCFIFSQYLQKPRHLNHSFLSHVYFPPPISFYPSIFWLQKKLSIPAENNSGKKTYICNPAISTSPPLHTKNITKNDENHDVFCSTLSCQHLAEIPTHENATHPRGDGNHRHLFGRGNS